MDMKTFSRIAAEAELDSDEWWYWIDKKLKTRQEQIDFLLMVMRDGLTSSLAPLRAAAYRYLNDIDDQGLDTLFAYLGQPGVRAALVEGEFLDVKEWNYMAVHMMSALGKQGRLRKPLERAAPRLSEALVDLGEICLFAHDKGHPQPSPRALRRAAVRWLSQDSDDQDEVFTFTAMKAPRSAWLKAVREALRDPQLHNVKWGQLEPYLDVLTPEEALSGWRRVRSDHAFAHLVDLAERYRGDLLEPLRAIRPQMAALASHRYYGGFFVLSHRGLDLVEALLLSRAGEAVPDALDEGFRALLLEARPELLEPLVVTLKALPEERRARLLVEALSTEASFSDVALGSARVATTPEVLDALIPAVGRYEGTNVRVIAESVAAFGPAAVPKIAEALGNKPGAAAGRIFVQALGLIGTPEAAEALVPQTGARYRAVRTDAALALEEMGETAHEALREGVRARKKAVREACAALLSRLEGTTDDDDPLAALEVRRQGMDLSEIDRALKRYLKRDTFGGDTHRPFVHMVERFGDVAILPVLDFVLEDPSDSRRGGLWKNFVTDLPHESEVAAWAAVRVLAKTPKVPPWSLDDIVRSVWHFGPLAVPAAIDALSSSKPVYREVLYSVIAKHGPEQGKEILLKGIEDSSKGVRAACVKGLAKLGPTVAQELVKALRSKKKAARLAAAEALAEVPAPEHVETLRKLHAATDDSDFAVLLEKAIAAAGGTTPDAEAVGEGGALDASQVATLLEEQKATKPPKWLDLDALPPLKTRTGDTLSEEAVRGLLTRLNKEGPDGKDPVAWKVRAALDDASADAFSGAIFEAWQKAGRPAKDKWAVYQLAILADASRLDAVAPQLDTLASFGDHHYARWFVETLVRHGSRRALSWAGHWARAAERRSLRSTAQALLAEAARAAGQSMAAFVGSLDLYIFDEVADRETPTCGLEDGPVEVSCGERRFELCLDRGGALVVWNPDTKKKTKSLPKSCKGEDGAAAKATYSALKKQVQRTVRDLSRRLESAMISGRTWSGAEFRRLFIEHPIFAAVGEALVFQTGDGVTFRISEDTPISADFDEVEVRDEATLRLLHRLEMSDEELAAWGEHLAEAKINQPFEQVGRPIFTFAEHPIHAPVGETTFRQIVFGLRRMGWRAGPAEDNGSVSTAYRLFPGRNVRAELHHGDYCVDNWAFMAEQKTEVEAVRFEDLFGNALDPEAVDPIVFSEVRYDLERLLV